jgi:SPP1 family predicted phage head-tail adaptor
VKCCDIFAGMLRNKIQIQRLLKTPDGSGGWTKTWIPLGSTWAYIRATGASEQFSQDRLNGVVRYKATIRYKADLTVADRVVFEGKNYQIRAVVDIEFRKKWMELDLESGVST